MHCKKRAYRDKDEALEHLHGIANKKDGRKKPIRVYECDDCGQWHLTSKSIGDMIKTNIELKLDWSKVIQPTVDQE